MAWRKKWGYTIYVFIIGMMCGEIGSYLNKEDINKVYRWIGVFFAIIALVLSPFIFNEQHLAYSNRTILGVAIGILILGMLLAGGKFVNSKLNIIDWLDGNTFAFYLVHVIFLDILSNKIYILGMNIWKEKHEISIILINYILSLTSIWFLANLYEKYIIQNVMRYVNRSIIFLKLWLKIDV